MKKPLISLLTIAVALIATAQTPPSQSSVLVNFGSPTCANANTPSLSLIGSPFGTPAILSNCDLSALFPNFYSLFTAYNPRDNNVYIADINSVPTKVWIVNEGLPGNITCPILTTTPTYTYTNGYVPNNFEFDMNGDVWSLSAYNTGTGQCTMDKFDEATGTVLFTKTLQFPAGNFPNSISSGDITILPNGQMFATFGNAPSKLFEITNYSSGASNAIAVFLQDMPSPCYGIAYANGDLEITGTDLSSSCYYYKYDIATNTLGAQIAFQNGQTPIDNTSVTASTGTTKRILSQTKINSNTADITYEIYAKNLGNVALSSFNITEDLGAVFGSANVSNVTKSFSANPAGLTLNPAYNGTTITTLLNAGQTLPNQIPGFSNYSVTILVSCRVTNLSTSITYNNSAISTGKIGSGAMQVNVADSSNNGTASAIDPNSDGNAGGIGENVPTPFNFLLLLPVNFISINASAVNAGSNKITWVIATPAVKPANFEVEKSSDGVHWSTITVLPLNNDLQSAYDYTDNNATADKILYRIKETDPDGRFVYSPVVLVKKSNTKISVAAFPNPAGEMVNVIYNATTIDKNTMIDITDMQGRKISSQRIESNLTQINTCNFANGTYLFTIGNTEEKNTFKVSIIH